VTENSNALDLEDKVFRNDSPREIARVAEAFSGAKPSPEE
jgi:hypothetical protein